jgi:hypothetical protein
MGCLRGSHRRRWRNSRSATSPPLQPYHCCPFGTIPLTDIVLQEVSQKMLVSITNPMEWHPSFELILLLSPPSSSPRRKCPSAAPMCCTSPPAPSPPTPCSVEVSLLRVSQRCLASSGRARSVALCALTSAIIRCLEMTTDSQS